MGKGNADVQIKITATDNAGRTLDQTAKSVEKIGAAANNVKGGLSSLGREALSAASTGRVNFEAMAMSLANMIPIAGAAAAAVVAVGAAAAGAANTAAQWWKQVDDFSDVTGINIQSASVLVSGMEMAGASSQRMALGMSMLTQRLDDEARAADAAGAKTSNFGKQLSRIEEDHAERVADAAERVTEQIADLGEQRVDLARDHTRSIERMEKELSQRLVDIERDSARQIANLENSLYDLRRSADLDRLERAKEVARQYADIDAGAAEERAAIESRFANANTELGRRALAAELAALDSRTQAQKDKIAAEQRDRDEAAERETQMRQQAIQEQINAERAAAQERIAMERQSYAERIALEREAYAERMQEYEKTQARIEQAAEKAAAREAKTYARQIADIQAAAESASAASAAAANSTSAALERLGINVEDFKKAAPEKQIKMIADGLNSVKGANTALADELERNGAPQHLADTVRGARTETDKAKLAMELFGKYGAGEWLDFARVVEIEGWGGMEEAARSYGTYIGEDFDGQAEKFILAQNKANLALKGAATTIGKDVMPAFALYASMMEKIGRGDLGGAVQAYGQGTQALWASLPADIKAILAGLFPAIGLAAPSLGGRAAGGLVESGTPYIIGERGPELFVPQEAGRVISNGAMRTMAPDWEAPDWSMPDAAAPIYLPPLPQQPAKAATQSPNAVTHNWTYSPTYNGAPSNDPQASFALMRALAGA